MKFFITLFFLLFTISPVLANNKTETYIFNSLNIARHSLKINKLRQSKSVDNVISQFVVNGNWTLTTQLRHDLYNIGINSKNFYGHKVSDKVLVSNNIDLLTYVLQHNKMLMLMIDNNYTIVSIVRHNKTTTLFFLMPINKVKLLKIKCTLCLQ